MSPFQKAYCVLRYQGPGFVATRLRIKLATMTGSLRRAFRTRPWDTMRLDDLVRPGVPTEPDGFAQYKWENQPPFFFDLGCPPVIPRSLRGLDAGRQPRFDERLRLLRKNRSVYFFRIPSPTPIDWRTNPIDGMTGRPGVTWCDLPDYLPEQGDLRTMWEPARAAWAIDLARAHAHGLAADAGELFWLWFDSFVPSSPPWEGLHWKCGQESSVRLIALALGFWSLARDPATMPRRWVQFARLAWATGYRVAQHIHYAISQKNNHAISEAAGLLLVSHLFPEFHASPRWQALGRRVLAQELRRQIYDDGSYVQHSMNYERVMLHGAMIGLRLAELDGRPFDRDIYESIGRCGEFLFQMMDPNTGRVPNHGNNDGAYILPLSECDFTDFRPVVQTAYYLTHRERLLPAGPWDEDLLWLFGTEPGGRHDHDPAKGALSREERSPGAVVAAPESRAFDAGGYYTLRRRESWAMIRCHTYRDRPAHCDQLHVDLWWRGLSILQDCGTYRYYVPGRPDVEYYFKSCRAHNNVEIDGQNPLELASRFMWFPWPRARRRRFETMPYAPLVFEGETNDYDRPLWNVLHRRALIGVDEGCWLVVDDLLGEGPHTAVLRWHMLDYPHERESESKKSAPPTLIQRTPAGEFRISVGADPAVLKRFEVIRGRDERNRVQGFASPYYGERLPIPVLEVELGGLLPLRIVTAIGLDRAVEWRLADVTGGRQRWDLSSEAAAWTLELAAPGRSADRILLGCVRSTPEAG